EVRRKVGLEAPPWNCWIRRFLPNPSTLRSRYSLSLPSSNLCAGAISPREGPPLASATVPDLSSDARCLWRRGSGRRLEQLDDVAVRVLAQADDHVVEFRHHFRRAGDLVAGGAHAVEDRLGIVGVE